MSSTHRHRHRRRDALGDPESVVRGAGRPDEKEDGQRGGASRHDSAHVHAHSGRRIHGRDQATVVKIIYTTLPATFDGPIAGYSTLGRGLDPTSVHGVASASTGRSGPASTTATESSIPTVIRPSFESQSIGSVFVQAGASPTQTGPSPLETKTHGTPLTTISPNAKSQETATAQAAPSLDGPRESGAGEKIGIAFGVVAVVLVVALLVFLVSSRRKKAQRQQLDDEKFEGVLGGPEFVPKQSTAPHSAPKAPRISLRPVTQFFPNLNLENHTSKGPDLVLTSAAGFAGAEPFDRTESSQSHHLANPFGNHAERVPSPIGEEDESGSQSSVSSPRDLTSERHLAAPVLQLNLDDVDDVVATGAGAGVGVGAAGAAGGAAPLESAAAGPISSFARTASMRSRNPKRLDLTLSTAESLNPAGSGPAPSPSVGSAAIAAAGGPANSAVHRVQLTFKPTLTDELELHAGELIRLLYEYDDGWALVIRLDRSQQGVVPRSCLSARPVKPVTPMGRPPVNPSGYGAPSSPSSQRSTGSSLPPLTTSMRRPLSLAGETAPSPSKSPLNPAQKSRPIERKPIPGQAY